MKQNEQLTMTELVIDIKKKYPSFNITPQHLGQVMRDNNKTRKRTRHEHFPKERYKKPIEKENEMNKFFTGVRKFLINKIICLDETSVGSALKPTYKSEQKMLNNFKRIFGNEKDVIVCFGDYEEKQQMKFKEATKGKGIRTLFNGKPKTIQNRKHSRPWTDLL